MVAAASFVDDQLEWLVVPSPQDTLVVQLQRRALRNVQNEATASAIVCEVSLVIELGDPVRVARRFEPRLRLLEVAAVSLVRSNLRRPTGSERILPTGFRSGPSVQTSDAPGMVRRSKRRTASC